MINEDEIAEVNVGLIRNLFKYFSGKDYSSKNTEPRDEKIIEKCISLWKLDYECEIVDNRNGSLCSTYPSKIVIPVAELGCDEDINHLKTSSMCSTLQFESHRKNIDYNVRRNTMNEDNLLDKVICQENSFSKSPNLTFSAVVAGVSNGRKSESNGVSQDRGFNGSSTNKLPLREYFSRANLARCRYRFPAPTVLCKGKYISRSATLSCFMEVIGKQFLHSSENSHFQSDIEGEFTTVSKPSNDVDRARFYDIKLLEAIGTSSIFDLMVENKKVKYSMNVSSSEKVDKENRYSQFSIISIPYPGCEFFKEFTERNFNSSNLFYDWDPQFNNASLSLTDQVIPSKVATDWEKYKNWDLRTMTVNYLKLILRYILDDESEETGFLIHCISGWDRTPLFVCLVRLSLWADGLVHSSLNAKQMLFFTLAYDWYLFGHQLPDRLKSNENILYFCFEFLEEIYKDSFMDPLERDADRLSSCGSFASASYETAAPVEENTPVSSFESLSSSSSSNPCGPPAPSVSGAPNAPSISFSSPTSGVHLERCSWPFNKENGFSFDGISENDVNNTTYSPSVHSNGAVPHVDASPDNVIRASNNAQEVSSLRTTCTRSPLRERNKSSSHQGNSSPSSSGGSSRFGGLRIGSCFSRRRKISTTDPPYKTQSDMESIETDPKENEKEDSTDGSSSSNSGALCPLKLGSNPVPVPGGRSRHSSASSVGSWQLLSTSDPFKDHSFSLDSHRSSKASLLADMVDSSLTIKEEVTPSSSLESSQSIIVFNRRRRLSEVRELFLKIYSEEVPTMYPEFSLFSGIVHNICQKLSN